MVEELFKYRKMNIDKLVQFGFKKIDDVFLYETPIMDEQFDLIVKISKEGEVSAKLIDSQSQDEYVLHLMQDSVGEYVGKVRAEFEKVLINIRDCCFELEIFKSKQSKALIEYARKKYGDELEFLWKKLPTAAVLRRKDTGKWYAVFLIISKRRLGLDGDEEIEIVDIRIKPEDMEKVVDHAKIFEGYHMNKKHWFTVCLDESDLTNKIISWVDESYELARKK